MTRPARAERNYYIANAFKSTPYGVALATHILSIQDSLSISPFNAIASNGIDIRSAKTLNGYQATVAEVDAIVTVTEPTLANSTEYQFRIRQFDPVRSVWYTQVISYTTADTGVIAVGTVATGLASILAGYTEYQVTTSVTTGVLTITAKAGYPIIFIDQPVNGLVLATSTAGVASLGTPWDMNNIGDTGATVGASYDVIDFVYVVPQNGIDQRYQTRLYINVAGANYAAFKAALKALLTPAALGTVEAGLAIA